MNVETLKDFRLTHDEWYTLAAVAAGNYPAACHDPKGLDLDVLILAGLVSRLGETLALTTDGVAAASAMDMTFDWDEIAYVESSESPSDASETVFLNGEPIKRSEALEMESKRPKPLTVGSLVRHVPTGGVGLITKHTMYDANWGGFYVDFVKPVDNVIDGRVTNQLDRIFDRGDKFERV
jgi:hypothetical protein